MRLISLLFAVAVAASGQTAEGIVKKDYRGKDVAPRHHIGHLRRFWLLIST